MIVRDEAPGDLDAIDRIVEAAFGQRGEADLVAALRLSGDAVLSLVAEDDTALLGHILFSKLLAPDDSLALGPLAVAPEKQGQGVGTKLVENGLAKAAKQGWSAVFLLGDPAYYARFGFSISAAKGFKTVYPTEFFMALKLLPGGLADKGAVIFPKPFRALD